MTRPTTKQAHDASDPCFPRAAPLHVAPRVALSLRKGYPWIWRNQLADIPSRLQAGQPVTIVDDDGFVAYGLWDPSSPIAVRIYSRDKGTPITVDSLAQAVERAIEARHRLFDLTRTNAYRLCHGEGDRVPAVVLDRYDDVAVARFDGAAIRAWSQPLLDRVWLALMQQGITRLLERGDNRSDKRLRAIAKAPGIAEDLPVSIETLVVREHGMNLVVDLVHGQKTGAFLDQRDNRQRVRHMSAGARVLNLFSYTGGFSCAAALGAAVHVTSVDIARGANDVAMRTFRANQLDPRAHAFVTADVFAFLDQAYERGDSYDLIISDPPSFAPNEKALAKALQAYRRLHKQCARLLAPGAVLCAASCSSHVTMQAFVATLDDQVLERKMRVLGLYGPPPDHPTLASWPEGRYLKFVVLA